VLFDVGGTLLHVRDSLGAIYARAAAQHGLDVDPVEIEHRFRVAWEESLARARARDHVCSDDILRNEWFLIVRRAFGRSVPDDLMPALFEHLYERFVTPSAWILAAGVRRTITRLRSRGLRLGILSNWDSRLPATLERLELLDLFDFVVVSYAVGYEKPHPSMFAEAIRRAEVEPARILHVGDSWESDIQPARELGMRTLWVAPAEERARQRDGAPGVESLADLSAREWEELLSG
jgi:putative hydrolase of the HAD superfamily